MNTRHIFFSLAGLDEKHLRFASQTQTAGRFDKIHNFLDFDRQSVGSVEFAVQAVRHDATDEAVKLGVVLQGYQFHFLDHVRMFQVIPNFNKEVKFFKQNFQFICKFKRTSMDIVAGLMKFQPLH